VADYQGSCLCGGVRFEVTEPFETVTQCHCTSCKKLSGGAGTVSGRVKTDAIRILDGEELLRSFQPDEGVAKAFCSVCGSNVFGGGWPASPKTSVRLSALDTPFDRKPEQHIFVRSVAAWETLPDDGAPRYDVRGE
jgi:hypothetical protein